MIPLRTDVPLRRTPWMNWLLIVACVLVYLAQQVAPSFFDRLLLSPTHPRLFQYFTYQFLHGSLLHIASNLLFLYIFGNNVNDKLGHFPYLMFFLSGGIIAGVSHVLGSEAPVLGASGSIAAVNGAYIILFPRARVTVLYFFILVGLIELPGALFIAFFFVLDVIKQFAPGVFGGREAVAYLAHIGGTVFGLVVSAGLLYWRLLPRDQFDAVSLIRQWNRRRQFRDVVASGYDPFDYRSKTLRSAPDPRFDRIQDLRATIAEALAHHHPDVAADAYAQLRALDPEQVLSRTSQEDLANHYFAENRFSDAAQSYELFLKHYGRHDSNGRMRLILGLIYAGYLNDPARARAHLQAAIERLHDPNDIELARSELAKLEAGG